MDKSNYSNIGSPLRDRAEESLLSKFIKTIISRQSILVLLFIVVTIAMGFLHLNKIKVQARGEAIHVIKSVLLTVRNSVEVWVTHMRSEIKVWSSSNQLSGLAKKILQLKQNHNTLSKSQELKEIRIFLEHHNVTHSAVDVSIISPDLINIASLHNDGIGRTSILANQYSDLLLDGFSGKTLFIPPLWMKRPGENSSNTGESKTLALFLVAPIEDDSGKVISLLSVAFDTEMELQKLLELGNIGEVGEIYFFGKSKLARPMLDIEKDDKNRPSQEMHLSGLTGENITGYQNRKGEMVIGAWLWYEELGIGLATEMNEEKASKLYYHIRALIISIMSIMATLAFLLSVFLLKIRNRTQVIQKILNNAVEQANEAMVLTDTKGCIEYANPYFISMTGFSKEQIIGNNMRFVKSGRHGKHFYKNLWDTITAGKIWRGEVINKRQSGELYEEKMTISPILDKKGMIVNFLAIKKDISEEKKLQEQLIQAEKLASIGTFASGVAHEINNPLTVVMGYAKRLAQKDELPSAVKEELEIIHLQSARIVDIVKNLLSYSRTEKDKKRLDVNSVIKSAVDMQAYNFKNDNISVETDLDANLPEVFAASLRYGIISGRNGSERILFVLVLSFKTPSEMTVRM